MTELGDAVAEARAFVANAEATLAALPSSHTLPVEVQRAGMATGAEPPLAQARVDTIRGVHVRVLEEAVVRGTYLHIHGGGWTMGSNAFQDHRLWRFATGAGVRVVSVEYRLAPEHPFPACIDARADRVRASLPRMTWHEWTLDCADGWSHHGLATLDDGTIVGYHPRDRELLFFDGDGTLLRSVPCDATEAHDIAVAPEGLWIADCGNKLSLSRSGKVFVNPPTEEADGRVLLVDLDGTTLRSIDQLGDGLFLPTGVAVDERGLWVADGYGSNLVHLVGHDGEVLLTLEGFDCPHGITIDRRRDLPLLYIAERGAHRLCVYDLDGAFVRHAGEGDLIAPCALTTVGARLYVADLVARVTVLDLDDRLVHHLGADRDAAKRAGWPNALDGERSVPPPLQEGRFNSPHGITTVGDDIVVTEWLLGGRWVRIAGR